MRSWDMAAKKYPQVMVVPAVPTVPAVRLEKFDNTSVSILSARARPSYIEAWSRTPNGSAEMRLSGRKN